MSGSGFELSEASVSTYCRERGVLPADAEPTVQSLGGGVSNRVIALQWGDGCLVLKQPLPDLAVEDEWPADVARVHNEAAAARTYGRVIEERGLDARVPDVVFEDETEHVVGFECAPLARRTWKRDLLDGVVDPEIAGVVGHVLGSVQDATATDPEVRASFANKRPFEQLRLDPYHRTTAKRHSDVADEIETERTRTSGVERTLVHGDYSPKNVIVEEGSPWILDFEVAHWGDPAFDAAFVLNHLFIKSVYNHERRGEYVDAALECWRAYEGAVSWDVEADVVAELGVLMLARVDGKSPVEYVSEGPIADALRRIAKRTLRSEVDSIAGFATLTDEEVKSL